MIENCGELAPGEDDGIAPDESGDLYPDFIDDATDLDFKDVSFAVIVYCMVPDLDTFG